MRRLSSLLLLLVVSFGWLVAQYTPPSTDASPYELTWQREAVLTYTGLGVLTAGAYLWNETAPFTPDELLTLDRQAVYSFDRIATRYSSDWADRQSSRIFYGSHALPLLLLTHRRTRTEFGRISVLYGETFLLSAGLTLLSKFTFRRPRPYVFNASTPMSQKLLRDTKASFVSGHTSATAANTFFVARIFSDYFPDSKWKPVVWIGAIGVPAVTAYLRVTAGEHYPTDVIAGYVVGAAAGYFVPVLHKKTSLTEKGLSIRAGLQSGQLVWRFVPPSDGWTPSVTVLN